ncbi:MAG: hypothetical protein QXX64_00600 [Nitrososphaera sp.]|nr:hypothetical protein [Candidatus Nitrososphaera gargensis]
MMNNAFESVVWIALGFVPTLVAMEVALRLAQKKKMHGHGELVGEVKGER